MKLGSAAFTVGIDLCHDNTFHVVFAKREIRNHLGQQPVTIVVLGIAHDVQIDRVVLRDFSSSPYLVCAYGLDSVCVKSGSCYDYFVLYSRRWNPACAYCISIFC